MNIEKWLFENYEATLCYSFVDKKTIAKETLIKIEEDYGEKELELEIDIIDQIEFKFYTSDISFYFDTAPLLNVTKSFSACSMKIPCNKQVCFGTKISLGARNSIETNFLLYFRLSQGFRRSIRIEKLHKWSFKKLLPAIFLFLPIKNYTNRLQNLMVFKKSFSMDKMVNVLKCM